MSMTIANKTEEQIFDASKLQQNGRNCNKIEELQLEDINDNNNDEVSQRRVTRAPLVRQNVKAAKKRITRLLAPQLRQSVYPR